MSSSFRLAGAAALCAALLLSACAKKTTDQTTTTTTDTAQAGAASTAPDASASTAPDATASTAPDATATTAASTTTTTTTSTTAPAGASEAYIDIPVYPGASNNKNEGMTVSGNGGSAEMKVYTSKDDTKRVAEWYKSHLPATWQSSFYAAGGKGIATFVDEHKDGDQSVIVTNQDDGTTRMQLTTKHGK